MSPRSGLSFFADNSLHALAYVALRITSPRRAQRWLDRIGRLYPALATPDDARRMMKRLGGRGTCLSRSLAVVARLPGSEVVIGVQHGRAKPAPRKSSRPLDAHAWVEVGGVTIDEGADDTWLEVGRIDRKA
jgi:hypothetical protein